MYVELEDSIENVSVADPDSDMFLASRIRILVSSSKNTKIVRKILIPTVLWLLCDFLSISFITQRCSLVPVYWLECFCSTVKVQSERSPYHCHKFLILQLYYKRLESFNVDFNVAAFFYSSNIRYTQCCGSGSAWIRIHFGQLDPDPHSETNADTQHCIDLCVYSFRHCCHLLGTLISVVVSGTDGIPAGACRLQSGQLQVLAAPAFPAWSGSWNNPGICIFQLVNFSFHLRNGIFYPGNYRYIFHPENCILESRKLHFPSREVHFQSGNYTFHPGNCIFSLETKCTEFIITLEVKRKIPLRIAVTNGKFHVKIPRAGNALLAGKLEDKKLGWQFSKLRQTACEISGGLLSISNEVV